MNDKYNRVIEGLSQEKITVNEPMSKWTTFRIGGFADLFIEAKSTEEIIKAVRVSQKANVPFFILGGGSNLLVGDKGIRGLVIHIANRNLVVDNQVIKAGAGVPLSEAVEKAASFSLTGLEFAVGIPGSLGGAIVGNAGAWQQAVGDRITKVRIIAPDGQDKWIEKEECQFDYRNSRFKLNQEVVLEVILELKKGDQTEIRNLMAEYLEKRSHQPKEPSAGCIFVNPKPLSAGALIEELNLKGVNHGGAEISRLHGNFIVNKAGAKSSDVLQLIALVKNKIKEKHHIELKEEIKLVGEF